MHMNPRIVASTLVGTTALAALVIVGSAGAQTLSIPLNVQFKGSVEIRGYPSDQSCLQLYSPPSPYKLRVTDMTLDSYGSTTAIPYQYICSGKPTCSSARSAYITAPAASTLAQSFTTGILVNAGETLSVCNYGGAGKTTSWTFHGVLYQ